MKSVAFACLFFAPLADSHELQDLLADLNLEMEPLAETISVNGLPLSISRVVGPTVPTLVDRVIARWRAESGKHSVQLTQCCGWQFASNIHGSTSRVIQWRNTNQSHELLWSTANLATAIPRAPTPTIPLIRACHWTTPVHGRIAERHFIQIAAHCEEGTSVVLEKSIARLVSRGWSWKRISAHQIQAELGLVQAQVIAIPEHLNDSRAFARGSSLVVFESEPINPARR